MAGPQSVGDLEAFRQRPLGERLAAVLTTSGRADRLSLLIDGFSLEEVSAISESIPEGESHLTSEEEQLRGLLPLVRLAVLRTLAGRALGRKLLTPEEVEQRLGMAEERMRGG